MEPANDTQLFPIGHAFDLNGWRARRTLSTVELLHLAHAGKRGKECPTITVVAPFGEESALDGVAVQVYAALQHGGDVETIYASVRRTWDFAPLKVLRGVERGVDVPRALPVKVTAENVRGQFTEVSFLFTFSVPIAIGEVNGSPAVLKQDTIMGSNTRKDAAKAFSWLSANVEKLKTMSGADFRSTMSALGVRLS